MARKFDLVGGESLAEGGRAGDGAELSPKDRMMLDASKLSDEQAMELIEGKYNSFGLESREELLEHFGKASIGPIIKKHHQNILEKLEEGKGEEQDGRVDGSEPDDGDGDGDADSDSDNDSDGEDSDDADGDGEDSDSESDSDSDSESESDGEGDGEEVDLETRVALLEKWRKLKVDPFLKGKHGKPIPQQKEGMKFEKDEDGGLKIELPPRKEEEIDLGLLEAALRGLQKQKEGQGEIDDNKFIVPEEWDKVFSIVKNNLPCLLIGPAGSGKTTLAELTSKKLALPFGMVSCSGGMTTMDLIGSLMPTGAGGNFEFVPSKFTRMCQNPGVFLLDEIDAADENLLLVLNSAIAQRRFDINTLCIQTLPSFKQKKIFHEIEATYGPEHIEKMTGHTTIKSVSDMFKVVGDEVFNAIEDELSTIRVHPEFRIVAAANTFGTGADRVYVGRNQLDEASLDRFRAGRVEVNYSMKVEKAILPEEVLFWGYAVRAACQELGEKRIVISTRFLKDLGVMKKKASWGLRQFNEQLAIGIKPDQFSRIAELTVKKLAEIIKNGGL